MVSRQCGQTASVVLAVVLSIGALALLFYVNSKEEESVRQPLDPNAAAAESRGKEAKVQALEERRQNFERQAEELQQKRAQSWNERKARQRGPEQEVQKKE